MARNALSTAWTRWVVFARALSAKPASTQDVIVRHTAFGAVACGVLVLGLGGWSALASINGAVIASGTIAVESSSKRVQHREGGTVAEIRVKDGDRVQAGDLLLRLEDTIPRANLKIVQKEYDEHTARKARLGAERARAEMIAFPNALIERAGEPEVKEILDSELALFTTRRASRMGQKTQLAERTNQLNEEIAGFEAQKAGRAKEIGLIDKQLVGLKELFEKGYVPNTKIIELERDRSRLDGEQGDLVAKIAQAKGQISEISVQILQVEKEFMAGVADDMTKTLSELAEVSERLVKATDEVGHLEIRAPREGFVHQSTVHTVGGVIGPGETVMLIVPDQDSLIVEVRVSPMDIHQVHARQPAIVRFPGFNRRTTPELNGEVETVSPDFTADQKSGANYYSVRIRISEQEMKRFSGLTLMPGMPTETFVQTGERTALTYLAKPLADSLERVFRED